MSVVGQLPDFIIIGAMKCATTTLHKQLAAQLGIFMSTPKEPCFFSNDEVYHKGLDWYQSLFRGAAPGEICGESSTNYTKVPTYPETVHRMHRHLPHVRLIYIMREPIDRLGSHYAHDWTLGNISVPIGQAIDEHPEFIAYGRYAMQLKPFLEAYGPQQILLVFFERLISQPQVELERICRFIGHVGRPRWRGEFSAFGSTGERLRRSRLRNMLVWNPVSTFIRRRFIPQAWRDWIKGLWQVKERRFLTQDGIRRVEAVFDEDLAQLGDWLGISLSCRTYRDTALRETPQWRCSAGKQLQ